MSDQSREIHRNKTTSSAFLLSRSEICEPASDYGGTSDKGAARTVETLAAIFPELITPDRLFETALTRLESADRFSAMIVRIDGLDQEPDPEALIRETAGIVDQTCHERDGFWGVFDRDMLACFFSDADGAACMEIAEKIRERLAEKRNNTVTFGIAQHPVLDYQKADILKNARKAVEHAEFFGPDSSVVFDSVSLNISGDKYYQAGDVEGAVEEFKKALELDPDNVNVLNSLGVCYGVREEYDSALECFLKAVELDPDEIMAVYNAGYASMCRDEYSRALEFFRQAEAIDDNLFEVAFQTGRVCMEQGRPDQAKKHLETAVDLNPESGAAFRYLGDCYCELDRDEDAAAAYKNALKMRPNDAQALSALGYLYEMQGRNEDIALMFCRRAVEMNPENGLFRHRLGRVYYNRNMNEEALAEFETAKACGHEGSGEYAELIRGSGKVSAR